jgi:hypothetical protein
MEARMTDNAVLDALEQTALGVFLALLERSAGHGGHFRLLITSCINGQDKPLLMVGSAHAQVEDGHMIAVLNPSRALVDQGDPAAGTTYTPAHLKEIVAQQCDAMLELWIEVYKNNRVVRLSSYQCRDPQPSRFEIR